MASRNILDSFDADIICVQETKVTRKCFKETRDFEWVDKAHAPFFYHLITLTAQHIFFQVTCWMRRQQLLMATIHTLVLAEREVDTRVKQHTEPLNDSKVTLTTNCNVLNNGFMSTVLKVAMFLQPLHFVQWATWFSLSPGVATYCKDTATPFLAEEGLTGLLANQGEAVGCYGDQVELSSEELLALDNEGRAVITQHHFM